MNKIKLGFALCGSFCTLEKSINLMKKLINIGYDILPIMSFNAYNLDTKFGKSRDFIQKIETITSKKVLNSLTDVEPIGPQNLTDIMLVCPCTGNTLSKITHAITDTPVTLAVKSHLRVKKPVVIALATNDALGASFKNFSHIFNTKHIFISPLNQDDYDKKPNSMVANFELIPSVLKLALENKQINPIFI